MFFIVRVFKVLCCIFYYYLIYYVCGNSSIYYQKLLLLLYHDNILFAKIFQCIVNKKSLELPTELRNELSTFTTNVDYNSDDIDYVILDNIKKDYNIRIDMDVESSGMIALVFRGIDVHGRHMIIKIKRKDIVKKLTTGCSDITTLYKWLSYFFPSNKLLHYFKPIINDIFDIIEQTNFRTEIHNLKKAKADLAPLTFICIPTVYNNSDTDEFILMEYLDGVHRLPQDTTDEVCLNYIEQLFTFTTYCYLCNIIIHLDLHVGNIIFMQNKIGIIDYGMAITPSEEMHNVILSLFDIVTKIKRIDDIDCIDTFKHLFEPPLFKENIDNIEKIESILKEIVTILIHNFDKHDITLIIDRLRSEIGYNIVLNNAMFKYLLGIAMTEINDKIVGKTFPYIKIKEAKDRAYEAVLELLVT